MKPITTVSRLQSLNGRQQVTYRKALHAMRLMQHRGLSRAEAARQAGTTPETMQRYLGDAVSQRGSARGKRGGRYRVTPAKRRQVVQFYTLPTTSGVRRLTITTEREYRLARAYRFALRTYIRQGDPSMLRRFEGTSIDGYQLETEPMELDVMVGSGELDMEDIGS